MQQKQTQEIIHQKIQALREKILTQLQAQAVQLQHQNPNPQATELNQTMVQSLAAILSRAQIMHQASQILGGDPGLFQNQQNYANFFMNGGNQGWAANPLLLNYLLNQSLQNSQLDQQRILDQAQHLNLLQAHLNLQQSLKGDKDLADNQQLFQNNGEELPQGNTLLNGQNVQEEQMNQPPAEIEQNDMGQ